MITQKELVNRLNQLTLRYNLTWDDIKYDADKAIAKINAYLGAKYPRMSSVMAAPHLGYTLNTGGVDREIFPDEYIHSVVIPYVAMEVLARDEEFTTIYNKYTAELEDGLFTMFQKEFNRVPLVFRQDNDQGVFFEEGGIKDAVARNIEENLPTFKFRVFYHVNNDLAVLSTNFVEDNYAYAYGEEATILSWSNTLLSFNGATAYEFLGWVQDRQQVLATTSFPDKVVMHSDLHLYAKWNAVSTLAITTVGTVTLKGRYSNLITYLEIPERIEGILVQVIPPEFCIKDSAGDGIATDNLRTIVLPKYLTTISGSAFTNFKGDTIVFQETPIVPSVYQGVTIGTNAFAAASNLRDIILPANIREIMVNAFPEVSGALPITIRCRTLAINKPGAWEDGWYAPTRATVVWGYNG